MSVDPLSLALSTVPVIVSGLNKKNYNQSKTCIEDILLSFGSEAERQLLKYCLSSSSTKEQDKEVNQLIVDCFGKLVNQPSFPSLISAVVEQPIKNSVFVNLARQLRLKKSEDIVLRLALNDLSEDREANKKKLAEFLVDEEAVKESSPESIHFILTRIIDQPDIYRVNSEQLESTKKHLRDAYPRDLVPIILAPLLYHEDSTDYTIRKMAHEPMPKNAPELSLAELVVETGYSLTSSVDECKNHLASFGPLSGAAVARALAFMARTQEGGMRNGPPWPDPEGDKNERGWNVEVFIKATMEMAPSLSFKEVVYSLDQPGIFIKDRSELRLLINGLQLGLQSQSTPFPTEFFFSSWSNPEAQFSLLAQLAKHPDVLCLADHPHVPINTEILKSPPDGDNKKLATWKCLGLLEALLNLMETPGLYPQVQELLKEPMTQCPDVVVLGLLQSTQTMTKIRQDLLTTMIPVFLGNHPNSAIILHHVWHSQSPLVKPLVMHAMAEWYMRAEHDQTRLSRILDLAQDLKALSLLLNVQRFPFVIDLACLASRREYLKLDKWLTDKMRENGENFIAACVAFLGQRCPQIAGKKEDAGNKGGLPAETVAIMLACLQVWTGSVSQELSDTINAMVTNCNALQNRARQQQQQQQQPPPPPPPGVMKGMRSEVGFPPSQLFPPPGVDSLGGLTSGLGSMALGPPAGSGGFGVNIGPSTMAGSAAAPGSPGKVFPGMSMLDSGLNQSTLVGLPSSTNPSQQNAFSIFSSLSGSGGLPASSSALGLGLPSNTGGTNPLQSAIGGLTTNSVGGSPGAAPPGRGVGNPHLGQERRTGDVSSVFADMPQQVSKDIEDETNSYFQRIYNQNASTPTLSVDEVLELLKKFQNSTNRREREIFDCMLRNLFEEYRFFPQYPDRELHITAQLFGGIMEHGLVTYMALGVALRYVLEAVRKPFASKMYHFGITALERFRHRLKEYPQYCQHLASIQHFREFPAQLVEYIESGSRGVEPPNRPPALPKTQAPPTPTTTAAPTKAGGNAMTGVRPSIANTTNIDTLLVASEKDEASEPPEGVQDKVSFIFNNLSQMNLAPKCEELKEVVGDDHWAWVAQYLVMKRASIEPNFHTLYSNFLDTLKMIDLSRLVVNETFRNIKVLLRSDKGIANFSDRSLLKNLGHWLGLLTLAKNKPILASDIDFKSILVEAYHKGQQELLYIVPFVAKVLESCAKSKVFKPPNPWSLGIMNVLAELHQEPDLKLNLKFEIEVLCKTLTIDIHDLKPGMVFKDQNRLSRLEPQLSQPQMYQQTAQLSMQQQQQVQQLQQQQQQPPQQQQQQQAPVTQQPPPQQQQQQQQQQHSGSPAQMQSQTGTTTPTPSHAMTAPPEPRFSYLDVNVSSLNGLAQHLVVNNNIPLLSAHPNLRILIRPAVERAVQDCIHPVVDWSMKIALTTCEQIIKKDFALDPDENRMRAAAHHMVRSLSAGTALIRCRDHLLLTIASNLKSAFLTSLRTPVPQQKELVEQAATLTAQDNVEPACAFIQKTAVEKSIAEIDKRLATEFELRKHARNEGRRYYDAAVFSYQGERMPEPIRLKISGVTPQQAAVYEEFARYIPGFLPVNERDAAMLAPKMAPPAFANDEIGVILEKVALELERYLQSLLPLGNSSQTVAVRSLLEAVVLARSSRDHGAHVALLQIAFEGLVESLTSFGSGNDPEAVVRFRDAHLLVLKAMQDPQAYGLQWTNRQVTRCWAECREEFRYNLDIIDCLLRAHLVNLQQFDIHLASVLEQALNPAGVGSAILALGFAMQLVHVYLLEGPASGAPVLITETDLTNTIEILTRIAAHARQPPEGLQTILELLVRSSHENGLMDRAPGGPGGPTALIHSGIAQARDYDDPHGLPEKTEFLLQEWIAMYHLPTAGRDSSKAFGHFVTQMSLHGVLKTDDLITRFFRLCTQFCVDITYRALASEPTPDLIRSKAFHSLDAYVRLIALLIKHSGDANNGVTKVNLLNKVLGIVAGVLLQDQEVRGAEFQQLAYHRILIMLFLELNAPEQVLDSINFQVLTAFCHTLHILRPAKAPGFAYAWLEIVSHRVFIGRLLSITPQQKGWGMYAQLLIDLFKFLAPFLRNAELSKPVSMLYKGTLRVLLVLLHDFPEFLCDYHYGFCDVIPPNCIQMRNLILSAFPRNMRLPDPFTPNLKVDMLPEISHAPRVLTHFAAMIQPPTLKKDLDSYLKTRGPVTFLSELRSVVQVHMNSMNLHMSPEPGMRYNLPLLNALVLYVGTQAIQSIQTKGLSPSMATIGHSSYMDIFQSLAVNLDTEGRYLFINAIANQLRYPNSHTHYFSCVLLCLFAEANSEAIQEQITRVLLERLIVNRPHPWGLLITFIELIKNPVFKFWEHEFVHCAPEIEKLFDSVARSCMVQKQNARETENHA